MNLPNSVRIRYEDLRSLGWAAIGANYVAIGTALENPIRILKISNFTDVNLLVSFNGVDDKDIVSANSYSLYDYGSNKSLGGGYLELPAGDRLYVKAEDLLPSRGNIYVTVMYVSQV